jgi:hypothetical protein
MKSMKIITCLFLLTALFAHVNHANPPELDRLGGFVIVSETEGRTNFIRSDQILSLRIRPKSEGALLTITTSELIADYPESTVRRIRPKGAEPVQRNSSSVNKEYQFNFSSEKAAIEFARKLISESKS